MFCFGYAILVILMPRESCEGIKLWHLFNCFNYPAQQSKLTNSWKSMIIDLSKQFYITELPIIL